MLEMDERGRRAFVGQQPDGHLELWWTVRDHDGTTSIVGRLYNDRKKRFRDGATVRTSRVRVLSREQGFVKTENTMYSLGMERKP